MVFTCKTCARSFTRSENLERHERSRHESRQNRPFPCSLCNARFFRSDVCKRHVARCARGLHTGKKRQQFPSPNADTSVGKDHVEQFGDPIERAPILGPAHDLLSDEVVVGDSDSVVRQSASDTQRTRFPSLGLEIEDQNHSNGAGFWDQLPEMEHTQPFIASNQQMTMMDPILQSPMESPTAASLSPRAVAPHVECYFARFHPFLPILHKPTFSLSTSPRILLSIVVALGSLYNPHVSHIDSQQSRKEAKRLWLEGVKELKDKVQRSPGLFREPWVLQSWILHIVYGCFFGDETCFQPSKSMLQTLVDNIRLLGLFNQDLTFAPSLLWTARLSSLANLDEACLSREWETFISQETVRICIYALIYIDGQISIPCNTRALISVTESNWDLMPSTPRWEAVSAEMWFERTQEDIEQNILTTLGSNSSDHRNQTTNRLTLLNATQSLMSGKPAPRLLKRLCKSPFTSLCILANIDGLIRDFTHCLYQMPPGLPDPSAFHVLSQYQTKSVNAALTSLLRLASDGSYLDTDLGAVVQLNCWAARLSLCEPDDLLVSGIADTTIMAGLATSAHLIMGSHVANRRATTPAYRRFGESSSMTVWDDLLKCLASVSQFSRDKSLQEPPWVMITGYRALLILWRTLRRAIAELSQEASLSAEASPYFNPANIFVSLVCERAKRYMGEEDMADTVPWEDLPSIEVDYISVMIKMFARKHASPVSKAIEDILEEIIALMTLEDE